MTKGFTQLKDLLPKAALKYGVAKEVKAAHICDRARRAVSEIWGAETREARPLHFKDGVLTIEVDDSAWAQEVFMKKNELIDAVGEIKDVRTRVKG